MPLTKALNVSWQTLAECFEPHELLMKEELVDRYFPDADGGSSDGEA
jgi:V/A-type H+-transporting ATPase subunit B